MPTHDSLRKKPTAIALALALAIAVLPLTVSGVAPGASASSVSTLLIQDGFNNPVSSTATSDGTTYVSGPFTAWGPQTGGGALVDASTATLDRTAPDFDGDVVASISDGAGGLYVSGYFDLAGVQDTARIAHIRADGSVDTGFQVFLNGGVLAMAVKEGVLYAGGDFTCVGAAQIPDDDCAADGDVARSNLASFSATGALLSWNPGGVDDDVLSMAIAGSTLFVGGYFTQFGSGSSVVLRSRLASFDLASETPAVPTAWDPNANREIKTMAISGTTLYVGGRFSEFGPSSSLVTRNKLAAFDISTSIPILTDWNPSASDDVNTIAVDGTTIYVGGAFSIVGGLTRSRLAALDASTGAATTWANPWVAGNVYDLVVVGSLIYFAGEFTSVGSTAVQRARAASISTVDSTLISDWNPNLDDYGRTLAVLGDRIFVGGDFSTVNNWVARETLASVDSSGALTNWAPAVTGRVEELLIIGSRLYLSGSFTRVNTVTRNGLAALAIPSGAMTTWDPSGSASVTIDSMDVAGGVLYVAGDFTTMDGQPRNGMAAVDTTTGAATSWAPQALTLVFETVSYSGSVFDLLATADAVYIGGNFQKVGSDTRMLIAALDPTTGVTLPWDPKLDGFNISQIGIVGSTVVFGGRVNCMNTYTVGGSCTDSANSEVSLQGLGGANSVTGAPVLGWVNEIGYPDTSPGYPRGFATVGGVTYLAGQFVLLDGAPVGNIAAFTNSGAVISGWQPMANGQVSSIKVTGSTLTLGGEFTRLNGVTPRYLQQVPLYSAPSPAPVPAPEIATPDPVPTTVSPTVSVSPEIVSDQSGSSTPTALVPTVTRKPLGDGVVRVSSSAAQKAKPTRNTKAPSRVLADAPVVDARTKSVIKLTTTGLPRSTTALASIKLKGKWVALGSVKVNEKGFAVLPAFTVSRPGTYSIRMTTSKRKPVYIKVDASKRN